MKTVLAMGLCLMSLGGIAQTQDFGSWNVINTDFTLGPKWGLYSELQLRSQSFYRNHFYHEVKGGVMYSLNKNFSFLLGAGRYVTYTDGGSFKRPVTANEFRFWQQINMNHYLEKLKFEHRYRVEQRWFKNSYRNRFRYRLNTVLPINKKKVEAKTFYLTAFEEIFLTNEAPFFERNRVFGGFGYQFTKWFGVQPGYVYQFDYRPDRRIAKHFFQLTLMFDLESDKARFDKMPGTQD